MVQDRAIFTTANR